MGAVVARPWAPILALLVVQASFASLAVIGKEILTLGLPPAALAGLRAFFAGLILAAIAFRDGGERVSRPDLWRLFGLSLLGVTLNQLFFLEGLKLTTSVNAIVLIVLIPVFTFVTAVALRREHFNQPRALGVATAAVGTLVMLKAERFDFSGDVVLGNLFVVLNCLCYSVYLVLVRPMLQKYRSRTVVAWTFLFGGAVMLPWGMKEVTSAANAGVFTEAVWWDLAWIVLVPTVLAYGLNNFALKRVASSTVAGFVLLQPLFGVVMAVVRLDEVVPTRTIAAALFILAGVAMVAYAEGRANQPRPVNP